ncbi:SDR family NAD(P)-dependent oxidoreductase [Thorsellia anophelis]|uniref:Sepiapterin reductase n=1 Tax=Thorsellia anophelis DSM 18579 TaxID=1123402 RepID=A0A1I0E6S6_9GAMM|nr:SDR family NAD(P)-dependent oxidoreductase [Thorsellia anophelis]SET40529.1 sepiapterin reductase [Thorsellia anophelis DSM 18579]
MSATQSSLMIITGASKGLGLDIAKIAVKNGYDLITIARTDNNELTSLYHNGLPVEHIIADLSDSTAIDALLPKLTKALSKQYDNYTLINNAGTVDPIGLFNLDIDHNQITTAIQLNVTAPMRLSQLFISTLKDNRSCKKIINISSGAGRGPVAGWGVYCATKAALDRFSEVIALESNDVLVSSLAPGVIDTQMQSTIRSKDISQFPTLNRFTELHETGSLASPNETAQKIMHYLHSDSFGKTVIDDIRNYDF